MVGKEHKEVLRDIRNIIIQLGAHKSVESSKLAERKIALSYNTVTLFLFAFYNYIEIRNLNFFTIN